jgi:2-polyprenyl-3-methyl-5-hydroxy-6-metoxy-1,4-benzoquinol methylase
MSLYRKLKSFFIYKVLPSHNMYRHKAERFYYDEYARVILPCFEKGKTLLDVGCQYGRFTIPAARAGLHVTATDIRKKYFRFIKKLLKDISVEFRHESVDETFSQLTGGTFDIVLCLELLYNLPDPEQKISQLVKLVKPGGILIISQRTIGYYVYRFIKEKKYHELQQISEGKHPYYNSMSSEKLKEVFTGAGLHVEKVMPVGMFSGFGKDPFASIANPANMSSEEKAMLLKTESNQQFQSMFAESARYMLIAGKKL